MSSYDFSNAYSNRAFEQNEDISLKSLTVEDKQYKSVKDEKNSAVHQTGAIVPGSKEDPYRIYRIEKQGCLVAIWLTIGLYNGIAGPTLPDLRDRLGVTQEAIANVLIGRTLGVLIGAVLGGVLFRVLYRHSDLLMLLSLYVAAGATAIMPWGGSLAVVAALYCVVGITEGLTNAGGNTMVMHLWEANAASPMNLLHFGFGVGALIVPQIAKPFLSPDKEDNATAFALFGQEAPRSTAEDESRIEIAYSIVAVLVALVGLLQLAFVIRGPPEGFPQWTPKEDVRQLASPRACARGNMLYGVELLSILLFYYAFESGAARTYFEFLFSVMTEGNLGMPKNEASNLQSSFWVCFTLGRGLSSPITAVLPVQYYLAAVLVLLVIVAATIAWLGTQTLVVMWVCNCLFGYLISVPFPNGMAWANLHLDMNSMATMVLLVGNSVGGIAFQAVAGSLYDARGPDSVFFLTALGCAILALLYAGLTAIAHCQGGEFQRRAPVVEEAVDADNGITGGVEVARQQMTAKY